MDRPTFSGMKGTPHVTAAPQMRPSPTAVLAGVPGASRPPQAGQPPSGPPACAFLPPPLRSLRGHPAAEGPGEPRAPGRLLCPRLAPETGVPGQTPVSESWTLGVRLCLLGESWSEVRLKVWGGSRAPLGAPSPTCHAPHAVSGRGQGMLEPGKGEPRGTPRPAREGSLTPALSPAAGGLCEPPLAQGGAS